MKALMLWISGTALAFFVTAGSFLLLANLGSAPLEKSLSPTTKSGGSEPPLILNIGEEQLETLKSKPGQRLTLGVRNRGEKRLSDISLTLKVSSEDTASPEIRFYRATVDRLKAGKYATAHFTIDLSTLEVPEESDSSHLGQPRKIVEVRATTPGGASAVRTAILPP